MLRMFKRMRARWVAQDRHAAADREAGWLLVALVVESDPAKRAALFDRLARELHVIGEVVEVAFKRAVEGSADGAEHDARLMEILAEVERARASSLPRPRSEWTRLEVGAGAELDRLADREMADAAVQARAYRALWAAARPILPGAHAGATLATIERGSRMRATAARGAVAFSPEAAVA